MENSLIVTRQLHRNDTCNEMQVLFARPSKQHRSALYHKRLQPLSSRECITQPLSRECIPEGRFALSNVVILRTKFEESAWKLVIYGVLTVLGAAIVYEGDWLQDTTLLWTNWPQEPPTFKLVLLYYFELSFYVASMFMLLWWEARRKDFIVMMLHHVVTATLIGLSLRLNFLRVGALIMTLHDVCDVFLEASKLAKYAGHDGLATAMFAAFTLAWAGLRLAFFPIVVLYSTHVTIVEVIGFRPPCLSAFNAMLLCLVGMHCYWFILILLVARRRFTEGEIDDARED